MNENGKNNNNDNIPKKNLRTSFNQEKININKSYNENNQANLVKEKELNNINKISLNDSFENIDENPNQVVSKILDNINKNSLSTFYDSDSEFKNKIDTLNLKFYLETEKYLCNQNKKIKTQTSLFIILFKQIIIYIEEIERLNLIIIQKKYKPENIIKRTDDITQKQKEFQTKEDIINALKKSQSNMESKLLQALINENNLNKKIEQLQKEIEFYRNKIIIKNNTNNKEVQMIKIDKTMSTSFHNDKKEEIYDRYNDNISNSNNITNNEIKSNKKKNSHNSVCITNSANNQINNIIKINKSINIKSKSPTNFNNKKSSFKLQNFKNINSNIKRNHSEKDNKQRNNNNKTNYQNINKSNIKKLNIEEIKYKGYLITDLNKNENMSINNKKIKLDKIDKNANTIEISETEPDIIKGNNFKKIIITNKNKIIKEDNITFRNTKKQNNNLKIDLLLSNSNLSNNINSSKKPKNEFNMNKCIYTYYNTITNYTSKYKSDNAFNYLKLIKNGNKIKFDNLNLNNVHQSNNNLNRVINKNILVEQKSKSLLKREKNNKNKIKSIINISNSIGNKKEIGGNQSKKS